MLVFTKNPKSQKFLKDAKRAVKLTCPKTCRFYLCPWSKNEVQLISEESPGILIKNVK